MTIKVSRLKPNTHEGSGRVRRFSVPDTDIRVTQISTFCPDIIGPGPVHIYLIENRDALILLDTGLPTGLAKAMFYTWRRAPIPPDLAALPDDLNEQQLVDGLRLAGYSIEDIRILILSHGHIDHFLMGRQIARKAELRVMAHIMDTPEICNPWGPLRGWLAKRQLLRGTGTPRPPIPIENIVQKLDLESLGFALRVDIPIFEEGPLLADGSPVKDIEVKHLPGHSPGSIGLMLGKNGGKKVLLCGDVLLHPITPIPDNLLIYLRTLETLKAQTDIELALPAHGKAIWNVSGRVDFLKRHHKQRLRMTYRACRKPASVWEIATIRGYFHTEVKPSEFNPLAASEALAHVEMLMMVDALSRNHIRQGVHYLQNSGEPFEDVYGRIMNLVRDRETSPIVKY